MKLFRRQPAEEIDAEARAWVAALRPTPHPYQQPDQPDWWPGPHPPPSDDDRSNR